MVPINYNHIFNEWEHEDYAGNKHFTKGVWVFHLIVN